jgi:hypothetical protein
MMWLAPLTQGKLYRNPLLSDLEDVEKLTAMGCGPGLDSTADAVLYNAPAVIEWPSPHEQGRRLIGHPQRHVHWRVAR